MTGLFLSILFILGACLGSFLCCEARRLNLRATRKGKKKLAKRSVCLACDYQLKWYDNIPIFSWIFLRGKCRKCGEKIGWLEILSEIGMGLAFLLIGTTVSLETATVLEWVILAVTLVLMLVLGFLAIYDGAYGELPTKLLVISIVIAAVLAVLKMILNLQMVEVSAELILRPFVSVAILGGVYLLLYLFSKGKWVGDGDWLLGVAIGLGLFEPWLAVVALFVANVSACLVMAPAVKKTKNTKIYFGPFMVLSFVVVLALSDFLFYALGGIGQF